MQVYQPGKCMFAVLRRKGLKGSFSGMCSAIYYRNSTVF